MMMRKNGPLNLFIGTRMVISHGGINFVTPEQRHTGDYNHVLKNQKAVYERTKLKRPERWAGSTRNWDAEESVSLYPMKEKLTTDKEKGLFEIRIEQSNYI